MRTFTFITPAILAFVLCFVATTAGQATPPETSIIEQLQGKGVLTDEDTAALKAWIIERVQAVTSDNAVAADAAIADLRGGSRGTPAFHEAYAGACSETIGGAYAQAGAAAAARLIAALSLLDSVQTAPMLTRAMADERAPVRAAAAIGLRKLQTKIAVAGGGTFGEAITALREAGIREESAVTLKLIYAALDYTRPPDAKTVAEAVVALLSARGEQYAARTAKAIGADQPGLILAGKLANELDDNGKRRLAAAAARIMQASVERYARELCKIDDKTSSPVQIQLRNRVELCIESAEQVLAALMQPGDEGPSVVLAMQESVVDEKPVSMKIEMNKWGDLIQQAYQIDVHMDVTETDSPPESP